MNSVDQLSRRKLLIALTALGVVSIPSRLFALTTADLERMSLYEAEVLLSDAVWSDYLAGSSDHPRHSNPECEAALTRIAAPICATSTRRDLDWQVGLVHIDILNASTCGGGKVFIHDRLIHECKNEAELASVIAHEVGHVEHRHAIRRFMSILAEVDIDPTYSELVPSFKQGDYKNVADKLMRKSYKRSWEFEADAYILRAFKSTGYSMNDSYTFFETLLSLSPDNVNTCLLNTHPLTIERIKRIKNLARSYPQQSRKDSDAFVFLKEEAAKVYG